MLLCYTQQTQTAIKTCWTSYKLLNFSVQLYFHIHTYPVAITYDNFFSSFNKAYKFKSKVKMETPRTLMTSQHNIIIDRILNIYNKNSQSSYDANENLSSRKISIR